MAYSRIKLNLPHELTLHQLIKKLKAHERKIGGSERIKSLQIMSDNIAMTYIEI